jgi:ribonuclease J
MKSTIDDRNEIENTAKLSICALGGVHEIGKNMYVVQYGDDIVVVDGGSKFPDESLPGIDLIIPDITYLMQNKDKVVGMIVTHGHEDHIGGIPYLMKLLNMRIFGSALTLGLIKGKLKEHGLLDQSELVVIDESSTIELGSMSASFFRTNHSIPDCLGIAFETPEGVVVHTGDFKFDLTPVGGQYPDIHKMAAIGGRGVLALLSESTNAERPGFTPSERVVGKHIEDAIVSAENRVFISTFASNVHRLQQIIDAAALTGRKVALLGRSMVNVVAVASELGHLTVPEGMLVEAAAISDLERNRIAVLCTGSQGESMAALARLASASYRGVEILPGDTVVLASSPIPGNERAVAFVVDNLLQLGAHVIYGSGSTTGLHVSGHASQEELKLMLTLMKPKFFIPIHGEYRMLLQHKRLAESVGVQADHIFIVNNGDVVDIEQGIAVASRKWPVGNMLVDGFGIGDVGQIVLRDRKHLSEDGIIVIVVTLSRSDGSILSGPDVISRGFVYVREAEGLIDAASKLALQAIENLHEDGKPVKWTLMKQKVKEAVGKFLYAQTKRRPMILPIVIEV